MKTTINEDGLFRTLLTKDLSSSTIGTIVDKLYSLPGDLEGVKRQIKNAVKTLETDEEVLAAAQTILAQHTSLSS